jgi:hypothetical protein
MDRPTEVELIAGQPASRNFPMIPDDIAQNFSVIGETRPARSGALPGAISVALFFHDEPDYIGDAGAIRLWR